MTALIRLSLSTIFTVACFLFALPSLAQQYKLGSPGAYALAMELKSGDSDRILQALDQFPYYENLYEDSLAFVDIDPVVVDGLISALESQVNLFLSEDLEDWEYHFESLLVPLSTFFIRIDDPDAIPVLLRATEITSASTFALAKFGPDIVPMVIDYMNSPERTIHQIERVSFTLSDIIQIWRPLDVETHAMIKRLAIDYMQGNIPEHLVDENAFYTYVFESPVYALKVRGASIASYLGDADLKSMVAALEPDDIHFYTEIFLEHWYDPDIEAVPRDQLHLNE